MTRVGRRLIEDFLLPSLNDQRYGERLRWVDKDQLLFSIRWSHKNAAKWSLEDTVVFQDWDRMKGHFHPENPGYYMQSKQRFRAALYKLNTVRKIKTQDKHTKMYQLLLENDKKRSIDYLGKLEIKKEKNEQHSRPSVICRNANYIERKVEFPVQQTFRLVQIKNENSIFSEDSTTPFSDNSRSSNDRCFSDVNEVSRMDTDEVAEAMLKLSQEAVKREDKKSVDCSCTVFLSPRIKAEKWVKSECAEFDDSQFAKNEVHSTTCDAQPMDMSHRFQKPAYCAFQRIPSPVANYPKPVNGFQSSRHVLAVPTPVYNKGTIQKLLPRKIDLSQPVDLSVKRDFYEHPNIPVSAR